MTKIPEDTRVTPQEWMEEDSRDFIKFGHLFTPQDAAVRRIILKLISSTSNAKRVADLGCGAGRLLVDILKDDSQTRLYAIDRSEEMLSEARRNCAPYCSTVEFQCAELENISVPPKQGNFDAVVSVLAIHHLEDMQKVLLFQRIYESLRCNGLFIYCDMFRPVSAKGWQVAAQEWPMEVDEQGKRYQFEGALTAFNSLKWNYYADPASDPSDKPSSLFDVMRWLQAIGFSECEIHWFSAGHGLLSALK